MKTELLMRLAQETGMTQYVAPDNKFLERFAEEIIKECKLAIYNDYINNLKFYKTVNYNAKRINPVINEHFQL